MTETEQPSLDDLLTFAEVQAKLHCSRSTVYNLVGAGELVMMKLRHRVRITRESLADYTTRNMKPAEYRGGYYRKKAAK